MKDIALRRFAGIVNTLPAERINTVPTKDNPAIDLADAVNVDLDDSGGLRRRAGQTLKVSGAIHSLWANESICLYIKDGMMYRLDENYASTALAAGLGTQRMSYAEANGRIYHSNGTVSAVVDEGRVRSWGISLLDINVAATAVAGNMPAGVYLFAMTLIRSDGQESGTGLSQRIDLADGQGIQFTWTVPDDLDLLEVAIYLTQPDGETLFQAAIVDIESVGGYTYTGGQRSLPLATQWLDAPPPASILAHYRGRIYLAVGDVLYATSPLSYEHCDLRDYRAFDGSAIRIVAAVESGLFIGTEKAVYFMAGAAFADNTLVKKLDAEAVAGSLVIADGEVVTGRSELSGQRVALFTTAAGVVLGLPDGTLSLLTQQRYALSTIGTGAAILRTGDTTQYLLAMQS